MEIQVNPESDEKPGVHEDAEDEAAEAQVSVFTHGLENCSWCYV